LDSQNLKVSVAMTSYNGEQYIEAQLRSILDQTKPPDEIIICDDGSTDKTIEIIDRVTAGRSGTRLIRNQQRHRFIRNFEKAIGETTGDIIFLSDQDDVWFPDKVETMVRVFSEDPSAVLVYSNAVLTDSELKPTGTVFDQRKGIDLRKPPTIHEMSRGIAFNGPMIAFRSKLKPYVIPISPLSLQWTHDHWIGFIAYAVGEIKVIDESHVYYRRHDGNVGGDADLDGGLWHQWEIVRKLYSGPRGLNGYRDRRRGWEDMVTRLREIRDSGMPVQKPSDLDELLQESESCLRFARMRETLKAKTRLIRPFEAMRLLCGGRYHRHAHGVKTFVQDLVIP
jgi:glycosyltransferase involved in cell wall biosynthesis